MESVPPTTINVTSQSGYDVQITIGPDRYMCQADIDWVEMPGKNVKLWSSVHLIRDRIEGFGRMGGGKDRTIGIPLTSDSVERLRTALAGMTRQIAATPEATRKRLRDDRQRLVDRIGGLMDQMRDDANKAWARGDEAGWATANKTGDQGIAQAQRDLADWDAAHPEIKAEIDRERQEQAERALWR